MNLLISSVVRAEESEDFVEVQLSHVRTFRGLVVIPTDSASPAQRTRYTEYAQARLPCAAKPQGPARLTFSPDFVGTAGDIAERLHAHAAFREIDEVAFALPVHLRPRRLPPDSYRHRHEARPALDAGCGEGAASLYLAERGFTTVGWTSQRPRSRLPVGKPPSAA